MRIFLIGMMGSGKSSVGELLSKSLDLKFIDVDKVIQKEEGDTISDIFKKKGEAYFREIESITLKKIKDYAIVSCGGGIIKKENNRKFLKKSGITFYLKAKVETLEKRLINDKERPLIDESDLKKSLEKIYYERKNLYKNCANFTIQTDETSLSDICDLIKEKLKIEKIYSKS